MMKSLMLLHLLLLALTLPACGTSTASWKEPQGVGVASWGMSMAELSAYNASMRCEANVCMSEEWFGEDVPAHASWYFVDNKFDGVGFTFPRIQFALMRRRYVALYGPPHRHTFPVVTQDRGGQMLNETLTWEGPHVRVQLEEYWGAMENRARLEIALTAEGRAQQVRNKKQVQEGKKGQ